MHKTVFSIIYMIYFICCKLLINNILVKRINGVKILTFNLHH